MRRDFGGRTALTKHRYTESDDFKPGNRFVGRFVNATPASCTEVCLVTARVSLTSRSLPAPRSTVGDHYCRPLHVRISSCPHVCIHVQIQHARPKAALAVDAVFLAVGLLGSVPGSTTNDDQLTFAGHHFVAALLGIFNVSVLHNLVHLLFGVAGIVLARTFNSARSYLTGEAWCIWCSSSPA